jgi:hypothetical protein
MLWLEELEELEKGEYRWYGEKGMRTKIDDVSGTSNSVAMLLYCFTICRLQGL